MPQSKEISQLHRIIGQLGSIEKMLAAKTSPHQVLQQIEAVRGSLRSLELRLLAHSIKKSPNPELQKCYNYLLKLSE